MLGTTTQEQHRLLVLEFHAQLLNRLIHLEDLLELFRNLSEAFHDIQSSLLLAGAVLGKREGEHDHADELGGVGLGRCDTDLRASVDVDTTVGHEGNAGTDNVDDADCQGTTLQAVTQGHEGIGSLARLRDKDAGVVTEYRRLTIQEVRGKLDRDGDIRQLLETATHSHAGVVRGTASNEYQASAPADCADVLSQTTESDGLLFHVQTTTHRVDNGFGLLENLLLHEMLESALHDLLQLDLDGLDSTDLAGAITLGEAVNVQLTFMDVGDVIVLEVEHLLGVLDDGRRVGREEELGRLRDTIIGQESTGLRPVQKGLVRGCEEVRAQQILALLKSHVLAGLLSRQHLAAITEFDVNEVNLHLLRSANTDNQGRTLTGRHHLAREAHALHQQTKRTLKLFNDGLGQGGEVNGRVGVVNVLGELGDGLGVRLGLELEALALEESLQLLVVGNDTIVDDSKLPLGVGSVRVAVDAAGLAVGGPPGVCNTSMVVEDFGQIGVLCGDELLQLGDLANLFVCEDLIPLITVNCKTGRVVSTVL